MRGATASRPPTPPAFRHPTSSASAPLHSQLMRSSSRPTCRTRVGCPPMRLSGPSLVSLSFVGALVLSPACGSTSSTDTSDGGGTVDSGTVDSGGGTDSGGASPLGFTPSNVDLSGLDLTKVGDVVLSGANCFIQPAVENPGWSCAPDASKFVQKTITRSDQTKLVVYV